jgi:hypothetical protein
MNELEDAFQELYAAVVEHKECARRMYEALGRYTALVKENPDGIYVETVSHALTITKECWKETTRRLSDTRARYEDLMRKEQNAATQEETD